MATMTAATETLQVMPAMQAVPVAPATSLSESVVAPMWLEYLKIQYWQKMLGGSGGMIFIATVWFAAGMGIGYIVKRYARTMVTVGIGAICIGAVCEQLGIISVHGDALRQLFGGSLNQSISSSATQLFCLIQKNALVYGAGLVGLIVGHMMGHKGDE